MPDSREYGAVVRKHHRDTTAYLIAEGAECQKMRQDEIARISRRLEPLAYEDLTEFSPVGSWMLAVILCPGDDLQPLVTWLGGRGANDIDRVRFYAHPNADLIRCFRPWSAADFPDPFVTEVSDWRTLHPPFGRDLNDRVFRDAATAAP